MNGVASRGRVRVCTLAEKGAPLNRRAPCISFSLTRVRASACLSVLLSPLCPLRAHPSVLNSSLNLACFHTGPKKFLAQLG